MARQAYDSQYRRIKALALDPPVACARCKRQQATTLDHDPPLAMHVHRGGSGCCRLVPCCEDCNRRGGILVANGTWRPGVEQAAPDLDVERDGLPASHACWRVPWLDELRQVPDEAVWPRLMTVPHPRAVGSLGPEVVVFAEQRSGRVLRWWQQLVCARLLEVDAEDRLCWEGAVLSTARQVGKSWLLRELALWRIHQNDRFGEPQDVLHTGKDLAVCKEVQRPARIWAKARRDIYHVREVNGQEEIELVADGSRWLLRAKEAVYGYSVSLGLVDEGWKVRASSVDEGLTPTMAEREQPQLLLVSTAHRKATALMLGRRQAALAQLEDADGDLLIEWSAPQGADVADKDAWRLASPHWGPRRERLISKRHDMMVAGEIEDPEEPDPEQAFRAQWLNQWPRKQLELGGQTEPLLPDGVWAGLAVEAPVSTGGIWVGLEDDYGLGAAIACARRTDDGRLEIDGWLRGDWDSAILDVQALAEGFTIRRLLVGRSLLAKVPPGLRALAHGQGPVETRNGLAMFRDLALGGQLVHDHGTEDLDATLDLATVKEVPSGLSLFAKGPTHLVKAAVWAAAAAARPVANPAVF